jgi:hypothetical protein
LTVEEEAARVIRWSGWLGRHKLRPQLTSQSGEIERRRIGSRADEKKHPRAKFLGFQGEERIDDDGTLGAEGRELLVAGERGLVLDDDEEHARGRRR